MPVLLTLWEVMTSESPEVREMEVAVSQDCTIALWLGQQEQNSISKNKTNKNKKGISWTWWHVPVISALWEAEVGGSFEPRSSRQAWAT